MIQGKKIRNFLLFFLLVSLLTVVPVSGQELDEKTVIVEGKAEGVSIRAEDEALRDALRNAVEEGVGVFVDAQTLVEEFQLLGDLIYTQAKGYISSYQVLSTTREENLTRVRIRAVVAPLLKLKYDLEALGLIKTLKGDPRIMITLVDIVDGEPSLTHLAQTELEMAFLGKNLNLVDSSQVDLNRARNVALNYEDYNRAAAFGQEIGAEIVISGQAIAEYAGSEELHGVRFEFYSSLLELRVVRSDTPKLLLVETAGPLRKGSFDRLSARSSAIKTAVSQVKDKLLDDLFERWRREILDYDRFLLVVTGLEDERELRRLEARVRRLRGMENVYRRNYFRDIATLEVDFQGNSTTLADRLATTRRPQVEVIGTTQNRVDLEIQREVR